MLQRLAPTCMLHPLVRPAPSHIQPHQYCPCLCLGHWPLPDRCACSATGLAHAPTCMLSICSSGMPDSSSCRWGIWDSRGCVSWAQDAWRVLCESHLAALLSEWPPWTQAPTTDSSLPRPPFLPAASPCAEPHPPALRTGPSPAPAQTAGRCHHLSCRHKARVQTLCVLETNMPRAVKLM